MKTINAPKEMELQPAAKGGFLGKRLMVVGALVLSFGVLFSLICALLPREPSYAGKPLSLWLADFDRGSKETHMQAAKALREMGAGAVPFLVARLRQQDSKLKLMLIDLVHRQSLLKFQFVPAGSWQHRAMVACDALGLAANGALPALEELLYDKQTAPDAAYVLARIGPDAVPILTRASTNEARPIRLAAKVCLDLLQSRSEILFGPTGVSEEAEFRLRISKYHVRVLRAANLEYRAQHPEEARPDYLEGRPRPVLPPGFVPAQAPAHP